MLLRLNRNLRLLSDEELVEAVCGNKETAIVYFFYEKYMPVFQYHIFRLFPGHADIEEMVNEFFLFLQEDSWRRLKTFSKLKASLSTWVSVVSYRYFKSYKLNTVESKGLISYTDKWEPFVGDWVDGIEAGVKMDITAAIDEIENNRDREIAYLLFIEDEDYKKVADRFHLSVDYIYTVKNRLIKCLRSRLSCYK